MSPTGPSAGVRSPPKIFTPLKSRVYKKVDSLRVYTDKVYMALNKEQMREYMRKRRADKDAVTVAPIPLAPKVKVTATYDRVKYPIKEAFLIALERVERAKRYALMFPNLIGGDDLKFQTPDWQYENEGIKGSAR